MICHRCIHRFQALRSSPTPSVTTRHCRRNASALAPLRPSTYTLSQGSTASRSISTTPAPSTPSTPHLQSCDSPTPVPVSSVRAGMPLKGLGYFKGKDPPVALEDHEYPDWLWGLLDKKGGAKKDGAVVGDTYSKSKKTRNKARLALKAAKANPDSLKPKIPIEQQSIDLPVGDGTIKGTIEAARERERVTEAMRKGRRKSIKEKNFLKTMR